MIAILLVALVSSQRVHYEGHQVWRFTPNSTDELARLANLATLNPSLDYWLEPRAVGLPVDIRVPPQLGPFINIQTAGISRVVHIADVQQHFNEARLPARNSHPDAPAPSTPGLTAHPHTLAATTWDTSYHQWSDIVTWMQGLAAANPSFVSMINIGKTYQNNNILGLKITTDTTGTAPIYYIDGGIHAREWMAPAVVEYIIGQFVANATLYAQQLQSIQWYFVPVWNVDGYIYTWTTDQNWRKNLQPTTKKTCPGTDLCRNAAAGFGGPGSSSNPCDDTYRGTAAWSAPETLAFKNFIQTLSSNLKAYVNFHSYAAIWLDPYGYTASFPADYTLQQANAKNITDAIKTVNGYQFTYGPAYTAIYPASGVPSDWVYDSLHVKFSQAVELRGNSFQPPASNIIPFGTEILAGILQLVRDVANNP